MSDLELFKQYKKYLIIAVSCYFGIIICLVGLYYQIMAFRTVSKISLKNLEDRHIAKTLTLVGMFYLCILFNWDLINLCSKKIFMFEHESDKKQSDSSSPSTNDNTNNLPSEPTKK